LPVGRALISGSPYVGVYLKVGERAAVVPPSASAQIEREVARLFNVHPIRSTIGESEIVGALLAFNSHGAVVGDSVDDAERAAIEAIAPLTSIPNRHNAMGNNVLANDAGALVHPDFSDQTIDRIHRALKVPVRRGTIAGLGTVGMAAIATNLGVVVHPKATEHEAAVVREVLGVPTHRSTANFGVPIVGACLAANSKAILVGRPTTPVEIVHLQEGLRILD
jgi:translation initiation factor 6